MAWCITTLPGAACVALGLAFAPVAAFGQENTQAQISPILTLDQDRLFAGTLWGKRAAARIEAASEDLSSENRKIEVELIAEEKSLTERRSGMPADEFRTAAEAFDARVTEIRQSQDTKARAIGRMREDERQRFYSSAFPVIGDVLRARGAMVVLDSRAIFLSADSIDITDELIARIDETLGAGSDEAAPEDPSVAPAPTDTKN